MARPSKSVNLMSKNLTKEEIQVRTETENRLKGSSDNISPPSHLNTKQKKIFKYIVNEMKASGILGNLDIYILASCSIAIERIQEIEKQINQDIEKLHDKALMSAKEKYSKEFHRAITELSLSPASRAKLGNINLDAKKKDEDPLFQVINGGDTNG